MLRLVLLIGEECAFHVVRSAENRCSSVALILPDIAVLGAHGRRSGHAHDASPCQSHKKVNELGVVEVVGGPPTHSWQSTGRMHALPRLRTWPDSTQFLPPMVEMKNLTLRGVFRTVGVGGPIGKPSSMRVSRALEDIDCVDQYAMTLMAKL